MPRTKLSNLSIAQLKQEIARRQKLLPKLIAQRDALNREIAALQGLAVSETAPKQAAPRGARRRRRARNKISLADALAQFMAGKERVTIREVMEAVKTAGYESKAKDFRFIVSKALSRGAQFRRVGRGAYALKS